LVLGNHGSNGQAALYHRNKTHSRRLTESQLNYENIHKKGSAFSH